METVTPLIGILLYSVMPLLAPIAGFFIAHVRSAAARWALLAAGVVLPIILYTMALSILPESPAGFVALWKAGNIIVSPVKLASIVLLLVGFLMGRRVIASRAGDDG